MTADAARPRTVEALRDLAMPVVIVGARDSAGPCGATATAMYASINPVELVVSLTASSRTAQAALTSRQLSVSLLDSSQADLAARVAQHSDAADKFADLGVETVTVDGWTAPAIAQTTALWGRLVDTVVTGDHVLMLLRIEHVQLAPSHDNGALVRLGRSYTAAIPTAAPPAGEGYPL